MQLFGATDVDERTQLVVVTLDGIGQSRLVGKSGEKAGLSRTVDAKSVKRSVAIKPTVGVSGDLIGVLLDYRDEADPRRATHFKSDVTLDAGRPLRLIDGIDGDGGKPSLGMKAEVMR